MTTASTTTRSATPPAGPTLRSSGLDRAFIALPRATVRSSVRFLRRATFWSPHLDWVPGLADRPQAWADLTTSQIDLLLRRTLVEHALRSRAASSEKIEALYLHAAGRLPFRQRIQALSAVARTVEAHATANDVRVPHPAWCALVPFIRHDPHPAVVSLAAAELAELLPATPDDPLHGPRTVARFTAETDVRRGAVLGGLVLLADRRAIDVVRDSRGSLGPGGRLQLLQVRVPFVSAAWVDLLVDWLEQVTTGAVDGETFEAIASALAALGPEALDNGVVDVERDLPGSEFAEADPRRVIGCWSRQEYAERLAPRLVTLAQLTHHAAPLAVLRAWGLDRAVSDPEGASPTASSTPERRTSRSDV